MCRSVRHPAGRGLRGHAAAGQGLRAALLRHGGQCGGQPPGPEAALRPHAPQPCLRAGLPAGHVPVSACARARAHRCLTPSLQPALHPEKWLLRWVHFRQSTIQGQHVLKCRRSLEKVHFVLGSRKMFLIYSKNTRSWFNGNVVPPSRGGRFTSSNCTHIT